MKAVLDTNVIISAVLSGGSAPDTILRAGTSGAFQLVTSRCLLDELQTVLSRPHIAQRLGWSTRERRAFVTALSRRSVVVEPKNKVEAVEDDPDDDRVLEAAIAAQADYVVSGDRHLLNLREYEGVGIVSPVRFAAMLARESL